MEIDSVTPPAPSKKTARPVRSHPLSLDSCSCPVQTVAYGGFVPFF